MTREALTVDPEQVLRFSGPGPRYTSYPTVPAWTAEVGEAEACAAFARAAEHADEPLSMYVHIPFCRRLCLFCACTVEITSRPERVASYLDALESEIESVADLLGERRRVTQLHWGGGTPTHLDCDELRRLHAMLAERFEILPDAEVSVEVHPHVTTLDQLETLVELGFNRISMGVQDTDPRVQAIVHRDQTVDETVRIVEHSRELGVAGVNLDLLYGLPAQTEETFTRTLDTVREIYPDRLAIYGYAHVPWLKPAQKVLEREGLPDPVLRARLFARTVERLTDAGYEVIGLDHFALPSDALHASLVEGTLHRNFMGYTTQRAADMVAFGMSAIADVGGAFLQNARDTEGYEAALRAGRLPTARGLVRSAEDDLRRAAIQSLMCRMRLDLDELEDELGRSGLAEHFATEWKRLEPLRDEGLCRIGSRRIDVLPKGRLFLRHLAMVFDAYLERARLGAPRYSQTV